MRPGPESRGSSFFFGRTASGPRDLSRPDRPEGPRRTSTMAKFVGLTKSFIGDLNNNDDDNDDDDELDNEESDSEDAEFAEMMSGDNVGCFPTHEELAAASSPAAFLKDLQERKIREEAERIAAELAKAEEEARLTEEEARRAEELARIANEVAENAKLSAANIQTPETLEAIVILVKEAEEANRYANEARKLSGAANNAVSTATRADQVAKRAIQMIEAATTNDEVTAALERTETASKAASKAVQTTSDDRKTAASEMKRAVVAVDRVKEMAALVEEAEKIEIDRRVIESEKRKKEEILREEEEIDVEFESDAEIEDEDDRDDMSRISEASSRALSPRFTSPPPSLRAPRALTPDTMTLLQKLEGIERDEEERELKEQNQQPIAQQQGLLQPEPYRPHQQHWLQNQDLEYVEPQNLEPEKSNPEQQERPQPQRHETEPTRVDPNNPIIVLNPVPDTPSGEIHPLVLPQEPTPESEDEPLNFDLIMDEKPKPSPPRRSSTIDSMKKSIFGVVDVLENVGQFGLSKPNSRTSSRRMSSSSQDQGPVYPAASFSTSSARSVRSISSDRRSIRSSASFDIPRSDSPLGDLEFEIDSMHEFLPDQHRKDLSRNDTDAEDEAPPPPPPQLPRSRSPKPRKPSIAPSPKPSILVKPLRFGVLDFPQEDFFLNHMANGKVLAVNEGKLVLCESNVRNMKNQLWRSQKGLLINVATGLILDIEDDTPEVGAKVIASEPKEASMTHYWGYTTDNLIFPRIDISLMLGHEHGQLILIDGGHSKGNRNKNGWSFVIPPAEDKPKITPVTYQKPTLDDPSFVNTLTSTFGASLNIQQMSMISDIITTKTVIEDEVKTRVTRFVPPQSPNPSKAVWFTIRWDDRLGLVWDVNRDGKLFLAAEKPKHVESQLWTFRDNCLINKQTNMMITAPMDIKMGSYLTLHHKFEAEDDVIFQHWIAEDGGKFVSAANENLAIGAPNLDACEGSFCRLVDSSDLALSQNIFILKKRKTHNTNTSKSLNRRDSVASTQSASQYTSQQSGYFDNKPSSYPGRKPSLLKQVLSKPESLSASELPLGRDSRDSGYKSNRNSFLSDSDVSRPPSKGRRTSASSIGSVYLSPNDKPDFEVKERPDSKRGLNPIVEHSKEDEPDLQSTKEPLVYEDKTLIEPPTEYRPPSRTSVTTDNRPISRPSSRASYNAEHRPPSRTSVVENENEARLNALRQKLFSKKESIEKSAETDRAEEKAEKAVLNNISVSPSEPILEKVADESDIMNRIAQIPQSLSPAARAPPSTVNKDIGPVDHTIIQITDDSKLISKNNNGILNEGMSTFSNEKAGVSVDIADSVMKDISTDGVQKIEDIVPKIDPVKLAEEIVVEKALVEGKEISRMSWNGYPVQKEGNDITVMIDDECEKPPVNGHQFVSHHIPGHSVIIYHPSVPHVHSPLSHGHDHAHDHASVHIHPSGHPGVPSGHPSQPGHPGTTNLPSDINPKPQGPDLPPIERAGSYIKYSHAAWESFIRYKYKDRDHTDTIIDSNKHILFGVIETNLRKEVARLLNLFATPIPEDSKYKYLREGKAEEEKEKKSKKKKSKKDETVEELTDKQHNNKELDMQMERDAKHLSEKKKKNKRLPEPLIIMCETNQLKETDFMIDVTAAFPTLIEHYPAYAIKILQGVCYSTIPLIQMKKDEPPIELRMLSKFPIMYGRDSFDRNLGLSWLQTPIQKFLFDRKRASLKSKTVHALCVVPLRKLCLYEAEDDKHYDGERPIRSNSFWHPYSIFTDIVNTDNSEDVFEVPFWDVVLDYKWRSYAGLRFFMIWFLEIIYMLLFSIATSPVIPAGEPSPDYVLTFEVITVCLGALFIFHEFRQMLYHGPQIYFSSFYNYLDLYCYISPVLIAGFNYRNGYRGEFNEWTSFTILLLWVHFLHQCRVFRPIGIFVNTLIRAVVGIMPFLVILFGILVAFSHGTWVLLADLPDSAIPANSSGTVNYFTSFTGSLKYTYWGLTGDLSALSTWDGYSVWTDLFRVFFSTIAVIYLLNLLIAMLSDQYSTAFEKSEASFRLQRAQAISEIEIFYMLPFERKNPKNFPEDIFFEAKPDDVDKWNEDNDIDKIEFS